MENQDREVLSKVVGKNEEEAKQIIENHGYKSRITARDGERFMITLELDQNRINLEIEDGTVKRAEIG